MKYWVQSPASTWCGKARCGSTHLWWQYWGERDRGVLEVLMCQPVWPTGEFRVQWETLPQNKVDSDWGRHIWCWPLASLYMCSHMGTHMHSHMDIHMHTHMRACTHIHTHIVKKKEKSLFLRSGRRKGSPDSITSARWETEERHLNGKRREEMVSVRKWQDLHEEHLNNSTQGYGNLSELIKDSLSYGIQH